MNANATVEVYAGLLCGNISNSTIDYKHTLHYNGTWEPLIEVLITNPAVSGRGYYTLRYQYAGRSSMITTTWK